MSGLKVHVDTSVPMTVLDHLLDGASIPPHFEENLGLRLLVEGNQGYDTSLTPQTFLDALDRYQDHTGISPNFTLPQFPSDLKKVRRFLSSFGTDQPQFLDQIKDIVTQHIPSIDFDFESTIFVVIGGRTDAFVEFIDDNMGMVLELNAALSQSNQDVGPTTWMIAAASHELWHAVFHRFLESHWKVTDPYSVSDPAYKLLFTTLDEGYAHYIGLLVFFGDNDRLIDRLLSEAINDEGSEFFQSFQRKIPEFLSAGPSDKQRLIHESHIGNMWKKWGAMTGALVVSILTQEIGTARVLESLRENPFSLWILFDTATDSGQVALGKDFIDLVRDTKAKVEENI